MIVFFCRGIDGGKNLPKEFLEYLYASTVTHEIKMLHGAASGEGSVLL